VSGPELPDDRPVDRYGAHRVTGGFQPRPPNARSPGDRIYDGPVSRMIALRNGQLGWRPIPDPFAPAPEEIPDDQLDPGEPLDQRDRPRGAGDAAREPAPAGGSAGGDEIPPASPFDEHNRRPSSGTGEAARDF